MSCNKIKFKAWDEDRLKFHTSPKWVEFQIDLNGILTAKNIGMNGQYKELPISQYTGIKDKNGVEIYCNYIIKSDFYGVKRVASNLLECALSGFYGCDGSSYEVIGNIYENKELLKV